MGVHQLVSNYKPTKRQKKNYAVAKQRRKVRQQKRGPRSINLEDIHLLSEDQIKHKVAHPRNNITVSGKRKRKMLKRLRHSKREKNKMEVEEPSTSDQHKDTEMTEVSKKVKKTGKSLKKTEGAAVCTEDVDMKEESDT